MTPYPKDVDLKNGSRQKGEREHLAKQQQGKTRFVRRVGVTWGISGDVCYMYIVLFCRYANHVCVSKIR
jgi:hypothetical protein